MIYLHIVYKIISLIINYMKILNLEYISECKIIDTLENNEIFIIKYLYKKINKNDKIKIKNKKNIISTNNKYIIYKCCGILFKITISQNKENIEIYTINKYGFKNNVLVLKINTLLNISYIDKFNNYKYYTKYDILQIGIRILQFYKDKSKKIYLTKELLIYNRIKNIKKNIFENKIKELDLLFGFYKEYKKYYSYLDTIYPYLIKEEIFKNKLSRLIKYYNDISSLNTDFFLTHIYDVVIRNYEFDIINYISYHSKFYEKEMLELLLKIMLEKINKYKMNKNMYLDLYYKTIEKKVLSYAKNYNIIEKLNSKIINFSINTNEIKEYIYNGLQYIIFEKKDIPKEWNIKNIDKWFYYLNKLYNKINLSNDFLKDYKLYIELLIIINMFYTYKNINVKYDFTENINELNYIQFYSINNLSSVPYLKYYS